MIPQPSIALPQIQSGKIRAYAVTARTRLASAPNVPTVDEAGAPGLYVDIWHGLWAPKGTPPDMLVKLNAAVVDSLADAEVRRRFAEMAQEIPPRELQTTQALGLFQKAEIEKWRPIIKAANITPE
jgi:tripartite-type tricarboxylate transporter receptor subunit TctC